MIRLLTMTFCLLLTAPAFAKEYYVVIGSFESKARAEKQLLQVNALSAVIKAEATISESAVRGQTRYRVSLGPFDAAASAERTQFDATQHGFADVWVYVDEPVQQATPIVPVPQQEVVRRISEQSSVEISRFVYTAPALEDEVAALLLAVTGKSVAISELLGTKDSINQLYVTNGFVNTGVVIPDQQIRNGELQLEFISGEITDVQISSPLRRKYVESRLALGEPFNLEQLQQSLKLLEQDPLISRIDARVAPGASPGEAVLALDVETAPRFSLGFDVANDRAPSIGSENGALTLRASNLSGWGETYQIGTSVTQGLNAQHAIISLPLTSGGASLQIQYAHNDSSVIEEPFNDINVESETESLGMMLSLPIYKTLSNELSLQLTLETRRNQTTLLGQAFSFSEGAIDGLSRVAPVRLAVSYTEQNINDSLAARFSISRGTTKFDATNSAMAPDGQFTSYLAQAQYSRLLAESVHITGKVLAQYAADPLLSIEKYALGGIQTIRGYRENQVVRDNAYLATLEAHYRPDLPVWVDFIGFVDWGRGENHKDSAVGGTTSLASIGVGIAVKHWQRLSFELYLAHGFDKFAAPEYDLQDDGVHIRLGYRHEF